MATITYIFTSIVPEFVVNATTADDQFRPDVVMLDNGELLFTFDSDDDSNPIYQDALFRRFSASGSALDTNDRIVSAGNGTDDEEDTAVATLANGNVVVVNQDDNSGDDDVEFHIYTSAGGLVSTNNIITQAEGQLIDDQRDPVVAALARGGFVVAYVDQFEGSSSNTNVEFVIFNNDGVPGGGAMIAGGAFTALAVLQPAVAGLANNTFVVAYIEEISGIDFNVKFRRYSAFGNEIGSEVTVSTASDIQSQPAIAALPGGGFALVLRDEVAGSTTNSELELRIYDASGVLVAPIRVIDPGGSDLVFDPDIARISDNLLLLSYTSNRNGHSDIFGQLFTLDGTAVGAEIHLEVVSGAQEDSALSGAGGGLFVTTWQDAVVVAGIDVSGYHVAAEVLQVSRIITGEGTSEVLTGDDLPDIIRGNGGDDLMDGAGGVDTVGYLGNASARRFDFVGTDLRVTDLRPGAADGADTLRAIEGVQFAGQTFSLQFGTSGDDNVAAAGNQAISAGGGSDTIAFGFALADASVRFAGNAVLIESGATRTIASGFETFVFTDGTVSNNDGSALVDDLFYYSKYHDVWNAHADADAHYNAIGWQEGRDPNAFFSTSFYLTRNPDVHAAGVNPLAHFDVSGWQEGRIASSTFNVARYLAANPDVAAAHVDPLAHFLGAGYQEGRVPFAELLAANGFDYVYYLQNNPDVAAAGVDPLSHFQVVGWKEGRDPNAHFDTSGYLSTYTDVAAAQINPFDHYNQVGWKEGRDPSVGFDTTAYLAAYPDVAAANINPLLHFLLAGDHEGRSPQGDGIWG